MSDSELQAGALVTPSIRLERLLGRGGMGSVWVAQHLQLKTQVVVKFMTAERAESKEAQQRFRREAELAAQAKSPHVVQIFDHGVSQLGVPYIAMELLEGEDLGKRIARDGTLDPKLFCGWLAQACRGLARAHAKGIVHRDIKPENIFLCDNDGEILVKVLDFGVAKGVLGPSGFQATRTGAMLGTAYYMSPEQTMGKKDIDLRSDLWSLAVVAFYALTGARPFTGDGIGPLVLSITTDPLPLPSAKNPALSPQIDAWMSKALARAREERFQSAKELAQAFAAALGLLDSSASERNVSASWPGIAAVSAQSDDAGTVSIAAGLAASTMSPSVSTGGTPLPRAADEAKRSSGRPWIVASVGGALLGLLGVLVLSKSQGTEPAVPAAVPSAAAAASPLPMAPSAAPAAPEIATAPSAVLPSAVTPPALSASAAHKSATTPNGHLPAVAPAGKAPVPTPTAAAASTKPPQAKPPATKPDSGNPLEMKIE